MQTNLFEKKVNKFLVGFIIGGALFGVGFFGKTPKGRNFFEKIKYKIIKIKSFLSMGFDELKKNLYLKK